MRISPKIRNKNPKVEVGRMFGKEGHDQQEVLWAKQYSTYEEWMNLMDNDKEFRRAWLYFAWMWESIGVLLRMGLIDVRILALYSTSGTIDAWEYNKQIIYAHRLRIQYPRSWGEWEYCYTCLMKFIEENPEFKYNPIHE